MATIATDGKGNYVALDASGNWVPTTAPPAAPQKGGGELGYQAAPPEPPKQPHAWTAQTGDYPNVDVPGGGELPVPRSPPPGGLVDTSTEPGPNVATLAPLSRDDAGNMRFALPNAVRAVLHEGPQIEDGQLKTPATTIDPVTGSIGVTPEAVAGGMLLAGPLKGGLRYGGEIRPPAQPPPEPEPYSPPPSSAPAFVPPGATPPPVAPLNRILELVRAQERSEANRPSQIPPTTTTDPLTGLVSPITAPRNVLAPKETPEALTIPQPPPQPAPATAAPTPAAQPPANGGAPAGNPPAPVAAPSQAIMTQAEMQAHARGFFSPADQAAATNAMLPDANATAVRKLFSDTVPSDPERARITASQPAIQAANNVDATGPMSYATAMDIDRDLTSRMRGASGSDAHDLSQLQQSLRTQMDQVPDLDNLRPGRLAWMQSIKQGQMEDINYGANLKNDPAAADAYVRQRATALLKNDSAMRNWTPEETAALEQVAKSGDIGMLGRLSVSLIKPVIRTVGAGVGHFVGGVPGAFVGAEVGGDIGATQAGKLRSYLSKTTLDPVMEQITRGVPPLNKLMPQQPPGAAQP